MHLDGAPKWGRKPTIVLVALLALAPSLFLARPANAHAIVETTTPSIDEVVAGSPPRVELAFNEPVEIAFGAVRVYDSNRRRVDAGEAEHLANDPESIAVDLRPNLADGTYTVSWRVVSADSHPVAEAFVFHVGEPGARPQGLAAQLLRSGTGSTTILYGVVRWINFASLTVLAGVLFFLSAVWFRRSSIAARPPEVEARFGARWRLLVVASWAACVLATIAAIVLQGASAGGVPIGDALAGDVVAEVLGTRFGRVSILKLALLASLAGLYVLASRIGWAPQLESRPPRRRLSLGAAGVNEAWPRWVSVAGAGLVTALLATPGLAGHAGTTEPIAVNVLADAVHVVGAAAWVGGLVLLVAAVYPATSGLPGRERAEVLAPVVSRFSDLALVAVAALTVTGLYGAFVQVRALGALGGTGYGVTLIVKVIVFGGLVGLGAINNRRLKPKIEAAVAEHQPARDGLRLLRRAVTAEVALVAVVLAVTSVLVSLVPARVEAGVDGPFVTDVRLGASNLNVLVDPNRVGANQVHLTATRPNGRAAPIKDMRVLLSQPAEDIGPLRARGRRLAPGHYVVQGRQLSLPGAWKLEVVARTGRFSEARAFITLNVNG